MLGLSMEKAEASHVYTYSNGFQGFAAKLNKQQAMKLASNFLVYAWLLMSLASWHVILVWWWLKANSAAHFCRYAWCHLSVPKHKEEPPHHSFMGFHGLVRRCSGWATLCLCSPQEYGQNLLVSEIMECLRFLQDGEGNANGERQTHHQISPAKTILGSRDAPRVAAFSSRGPNSLTPEILKVIGIEKRSYQSKVYWCVYKTLMHSVARYCCSRVEHIGGMVSC